LVGEEVTKLSESVCELQDGDKKVSWNCQKVALELWGVEFYVSGKNFDDCNSFPKYLITQLTFAFMLFQPNIVEIGPT
jgi:hypothetical protein